MACIVPRSSPGRGCGRRWLPRTNPRSVRRGVSAARPRPAGHGGRACAPRSRGARHPEPERLARASRARPARSDQADAPSPSTQTCRGCRGRRDRRAALLDGESTVSQPAHAGRPPVLRRSDLRRGESGPTRGRGSPPFYAGPASSLLATTISFHRPRFSSRARTRRTQRRRRTRPRASKVCST
jgi:hypothetical protein